jgi:predicted alpha/beta superfamily hydrolase
MNFLQIKKISLSLIFSIFFVSLFAQLTINVTSIPLTTPTGSKIYIAGNMNAWSPNKDTLVNKGNGKYSITITPPSGTVEFKFTRGTWASVEGNASGSFQANHTVAYSGTAKSFDLPILSWEDGGNGTGTTVTQTAAANVTIISQDFAMPQFNNRKRRIWLMLPKDYSTQPNKKYPVLYLQDGQNLFDKGTSFSGEWEVDESLNKLFDQGDRGCIVVGIDNGGADRIAEYTPWSNAKYGGGDGAKYTDFIVQTLKPYIDAHYRTFPYREQTAIGGSSLGGLISMYACIEHQDVFSKGLIFSPSFWWSPEAFAQVTKKGKQQNMKFYLLAGENEEPDDDVVLKLTQMKTTLESVGFKNNEISYNTHPDGTHSEWYWRREFPAGYQWLFKDLATATETLDETPKITIFPNPAHDSVTIKVEKDLANLRLEVYDSNGRRVAQKKNIGETISLETTSWQDGTYIFMFKQNGKKVYSQKVVVAH